MATPLCQCEARAGAAWQGSFWGRCLGQEHCGEVPLADGRCLRGQPRWLCQGDEAAQREATSHAPHWPWT